MKWPVPLLSYQCTGSTNEYLKCACMHACISITISVLSDMSECIISVSSGWTEPRLGLVGLPYCMTSTVLKISAALWFSGYFPPHTYCMYILHSIYILGTSWKTDTYWFLEQEQLQTVMQTTVHCIVVKNIWHSSYWSALDLEMQTAKIPLVCVKYPSQHKVQREMSWEQWMQFSE